MSYEAALEAAGATVHAFGQFGSYQGEWFALVTYKGGRGWVNGWYGSCPGCDAFEAEFGYGDGDECEEHRYRNSQPECVGCAAAKDSYQKKLADFGRTYLDGLLTQSAAEEAAARDIEWDFDAKAMLDFVKSRAEAR